MTVEQEKEELEKTFNKLRKVGERKGYRLRKDAGQRFNNEIESNRGLCSSVLDLEWEIKTKRKKNGTILFWLEVKTVDLEEDDDDIETEEIPLSEEPSHIETEEVVSRQKPSQCNKSLANVEKPRQLKKKVGMRMTSQLVERLDNYCLATKVKKIAVIEQALREYLSRNA